MFGGGGSGPSFGAGAGGASIMSGGLAGGLAAGAGSLGGAIYTANVNQNIASANNAANWQVMLEQQDFQRKMSSTAHQRQVADMRAAGLNPILSAGGGGASTPSGGSMTNQASFLDPSMAEKAISTALDAVRLKKEISVAEEQAKNIKADTAIKKVVGAKEKAALPAAEEHARINKEMAGFDAVSNRWGSAAGFLGSALRLLGFGKSGASKSGFPRGSGYFPSTNSAGSKAAEDIALRAAGSRGIPVKP